jgi:CheY-like chemotaxis protein
VDDEHDIALLIKRYLERGGYQALIARDGADALRLARAEHPDLITLDVLLPGADGFTVLEWLKSDPATAGIPVMMLSIVPDDGPAKLVGAVEYLVKPVPEQALLAEVGRILSSRRQAPVLVADDDADVRALLAGQLRRAGYQVMEAADGAEAVELAKRQPPGLALLDVQMPGVGGIAALQALRAARETRDVPVVMMTASPGLLEASRSAVEAIGGATLLSKPCSPGELAAAIVHALGGGTSGRRGEGPNVEAGGGQGARVQPGTLAGDDVSAPGETATHSPARG